MSTQQQDAIYAAIDAETLIDPHTHIDPKAPTSASLLDLLGYHYYTELAHSAGMPKEIIEAPGIDSAERTRRLVENLRPIENTVQYSWLIEAMREFYGFEEDRLTIHNWRKVYDRSIEVGADPDWPRQCLAKSGIASVFLTNEFHDPLNGFDSQIYVPCLRVDDLVFQFAKPEVRLFLSASTGVEITSPRSLLSALRATFSRFVSRGARACAISLPTSFSPAPIRDSRVFIAMESVLKRSEEASLADREAVGVWLFWQIATLCQEFRLPFDLMIGVTRGVYRNGVHQGRDLYDSRVSLIQYRELFNHFSDVCFPVSVLASVTNQELVSYAWIFPNVYVHGHWWYSNTPEFIERDLAARLEAVPQTKLIGYYSDMYKLEFALPKFRMFKRVLAKVLAERFVRDRRWSEERAIELGLQVLRRNVDQVFIRANGHK